MDISPLNQIDFYKVDHRSQYPKGTTLVFSNFTARKSRIPGVDSIVFFGLQYFIKEYLIRQWNEKFFSKPKEKVVGEYKRRIINSLGDCITYDHLNSLHDLGYLPIEIKALPEGSKVPMRVPSMVIYNTHPDFFWLTNYLETILSSVLWGGCNSATIADQYKEILNRYADITVGNRDFAQWQGHDFSARGMFGHEASCISGAAHLLSFTGTDTVSAIDFLEQYYNADCEKELIGASVPATEHSVMSMGKKETELETYKRLLTEVYPKGIVSVVSDTWDFWNVVTNIVPSLKTEIMNREGKLVIRPDSGDPVKILCGDQDAPINSPEHKGLIQLLWEIFGGTITEKGYKMLDSHIGCIYGDSITLERCQQICEQLEVKGFCSFNFVLGIGSYTYQYVTRDTFGFAIKSTYGEIDGKPQEIFKLPKTDDGTKNSLKGLLAVYPSVPGEGYHVVEQTNWDAVNNCAFQTVFKDGKIYNEQSLSEIRKVLKW